jgi:predicted transcriptional regulator
MADAEEKWWESAEDHKMALEILQLKIRREIMAYIGVGNVSHAAIRDHFGLTDFMAAYHLSLLEKALVVKKDDDGFCLTKVGLLYLEHVEGGKARKPA